MGAQLDRRRLWGAVLALLFLALVVLTWQLARPAPEPVETAPTPDTRALAGERREPADLQAPADDPRDRRPVVEQSLEEARRLVFSARIGTGTEATMVGEEGSPVTEFLWHVRPPGGSAFGQWPPEHGSRGVDAWRRAEAGRASFVVEGLDPDTPYELTLHYRRGTAEVRGLRHMLRWSSVRTGEYEVEALPLYDGPTCRVRVTDPEGRPLDDVYLRVTRTTIDHALVADLGVPKILDVQADETSVAFVAPPNASTVGHVEAAYFARATGFLGNFGPTGPGLLRSDGAVWECLVLEGEARKEGFETTPFTLRPGPLQEAVLQPIPAHRRTTLRLFAEYPSMPELTLLVTARQSTRRLASRVVPPRDGVHEWTIPERIEHAQVTLYELDGGLMSWFPPDGEILTVETAESSDGVLGCKFPLHDLLTEISGRVVHREGCEHGTGVAMVKLANDAEDFLYVLATDESGAFSCWVPTECLETMENAAGACSVVLAE